jgi:hypothetical protein
MVAGRQWTRKDVDMKRFLAALAGATLAFGVVSPALAYVGPGAGLSLLGAFWGLLVAVFAAIAFVLLWPLRRALKRRRGQAAAGSPEHRRGQAAATSPEHRRVAEAPEKAPLASPPPSSS